MAKKTSTPRQETAARIARTEAYANKVRALFATTVNQILALNKSVPQLPTGEMFSFDAQSQKMQKQVEQLLRQLHSVATMAIQQGITLEWGQANAAADQLVRSVFGKKVMESPEFSAWGKRNAVAMQAFMNRSEKGLNLSDRVWQSVRQLRDEMEVAITISVGEGKSAQKMSQDVRQYLNDPDLMFRRFRYKDPETGEWKKKWKKRIRKPDGTFGFVDCDRDSYRTGQGVYKSSAKNAMRVARTETNIAYRRADNKRWSQMDFVLGQRVQLSGDHPKKDICDKLQGDYPKDFVFDGWHPQCFCYVTPITLPPEETAHLTEMMLKGEDWRAELERLKRGREITSYPENFKSWVRSNAENIAEARARGTEPYFIRNNATAIDKILNNEPQTPTTQNIEQKTDVPEVSAMDNFISKAESLIAEMEAEQNFNFKSKIDELKHYIETLKNDKSKWDEDGSAEYYESALSKIKDKWKEYKQSDEFKLDSVYKSTINVVRERIAKSMEWGWDTSKAQMAIDELILNPTRENYLNLIAESNKLHAKLLNANNKLNDFITQSDTLIKEADKIGIKTEQDELRRYLFMLRGRDKVYTWVNYKKEINKSYKDLEAAIAAAKSKKLAEAAKANEVKFTGEPHSAMKTEYKTNAEVDETFNEINKDFTSEKWLERGTMKLAKETQLGNNGSTNMRGTIWLTETRLKLVRSALGKIGSKKTSEITFEEADAMATFWHEITHNRSVPGNMYLTSTERRFMELANEFVARHSLDEFYAKLGASKVPHPEFMNNRVSTGYNSMVTNYDYVINKLGLDRAKVTASVRNHLFNEKYNDQKTGLQDGLINGGLKYANGKPAKKSDINSLLKLIRTTENVRQYDWDTKTYKTTTKEEIILEWLKSKGFVK